MMLKGNEGEINNCNARWNGGKSMVFNAKKVANCHEYVINVSTYPAIFSDFSSRFVLQQRGATRGNVKEWRKRRALQDNPTTSATNHSKGQNIFCPAHIDGRI